MKTVRLKMKIFTNRYVFATTHNLETGHFNQRAMDEVECYSYALQCCGLREMD